MKSVRINTFLHFHNHFFFRFDVLCLDVFVDKCNFALSWKGHHAFSQNATGLLIQIIATVL